MSIITYTVKQLSRISSKNENLEKILSMIFDDLLNAAIKKNNEVTYKIDFFEDPNFVINFENDKLKCNLEHIKSIEKFILNVDENFKVSFFPYQSVLKISW